MKFNASVRTESFHRIIYNLRLFQVGKLAKPARLEFAVDNNEHSLVGSVDDNYTYVREWATCSITEPLTLNLAATDMKALELALRDHDEDYVEVEWTPEHGLCPLGMSGVFPSGIVVEDDPMRDMFNEFRIEERSNTIEPFALNPDRFRKLSLLKPGDYPVDMRRVNHKDFGDLVLFKAGPNLKGALTTLDRKILSDRVASGSFLW